ncbi:hypothetical protein [Streptomyces sp. NPDC058308]|uniref:hypothetical protein n=1 Tax=Streptomyces sp. NPDC058308 TaxID=3346440 RepID=UPI0036E08DB6
MMKHWYARHRRPRRRPALGLPAAVGCLALSACGTGSAADPAPPEGSARQAHHRLLQQFRSWARDTGESRTARHARAVFTVRLADSGGAYDYDVELKTDWPARAERTEELAGLFRTWWDGDDGDGSARDLVLLDVRGNRLGHTRL